MRRSLLKRLARRTKTTRRGRLLVQTTVLTRDPALDQTPVSWTQLRPLRRFYDRLSLPEGRRKLL